jgi:hypothetical protein
MSGVNPGFGYWWLQTTNGFELWVGPPIERSAFLGVFGVIAVVWLVYFCLWEVLQIRRSGASRAGLDTQVGGRVVSN